MLFLSHFFNFFFNLLFTFPNMIFSYARCWSFSLFSNNLINISIPFSKFKFPISLFDQRINPIQLCCIIMLCAMLIIPWTRPCFCILLNLFQIASPFCNIILIFFPFLSTRCVFSILYLF